MVELPPVPPFLVGNRCGFVAGDPKQFGARAGMPWISMLQARLFEVLRTRKASGTLFWGRKRRRGILHDLARLVPRGERREAMGIVGQFLVQFLQIDNLQVIRREPWIRRKESIGVDRAYIARSTGLSLSRVARALVDLTDCGWFGRYQPRQKKDGKVTGKACVRWVTHKLLAALGLWGSFQALRAKLKFPPAKVPSGSDPTVALLARTMRFQA